MTSGEVGKGTLDPWMSIHSPDLISRNSQMYPPIAGLYLAPMRR